MSGTSGSYMVGGSGAGGLPAPKAQLYIPVTAPALVIPEKQPAGGGAAAVVAEKHVKITVPGVPEAFLAPGNSFGLQLELLRYVRRASRDNASSGNGAKVAAYVHPSNGPAPSGDGSFTHGGSHGGVDAAVQALRITEWPIADALIPIDVTQSMLAFMCIGDVAYRDNAGNYATVKAIYPSERVHYRFRMPGRRFPYSQAFAPGYFAFRLSVLDPSDPRGKRIHGPSSQIIRCTSAQMPFDPAGLDAGGNAQANVSPMYVPENVTFFFSTRIP